ncbi:MAG: hypothetical protein M1825_003494 [Sarcosagium campestre]|nr:MAG: hypothetical protein M1825_003494 [Sarcosagium campestre]
MTSIVPEVNDETRVIAILGSTDASPKGDGWMFADFCILNQLLRNQGIEQVWWHATDFDNAVDEFGPIIHGQPHRARKVVCSSGQSLSHLRFCPVRELRERFLRNLQQFGADSKPGDRLLIILIGHGSIEPDLGLLIGELDPTDPQTHVMDPDSPEFDPRYRITRQDVEQNLTTMSPFATRCILSNSCYSGGWICSNSSRSVMAAVNDENESVSVQRSASGAYRGSYFTAAFCDALRFNQSAETTFREQTKNVSERLGELWEFLLETNPPVFAAQNDAWGDAFSSQTGLVQAEYGRRYNDLPSVPPNPLDFETDRQRGSLRSRYVKRLVRSYRASNPGRLTTPSNMTVDAAIATFEGKIPNSIMTPQKLGSLAIALRHRLKQAFLASSIIIEAGLAPFPTFATFDADSWPHRKSKRELIHHAELVIRRFDLLLPKVPKLQGGHRVFRKPYQYVACAAAAKGLDTLELHRRLANIQRRVFPTSDIPSDIYEFIF